jgi:hypothetical protein
MENIDIGIYFILGINKADSSVDRTVVRLKGKSNGKNEYEDLRTLKIISALARGNRVLIVNRCVGTKEKDNIISCEPIDSKLVNDTLSGNVDFENMDDETRRRNVSSLLSAHDESKRKRAK